ncbi:flagellin N-terminal helical domain-containing protein [Massilia litorea]|jgi:flagellin|uniref:Flagellin n=1 Tax=Massilia litorea TaxID=2769491 RepID=A0A7L9U9L8_9BURK|nr:flagellin [Massilia litorea]QOL51751.1 flagellin FliC [Massilia litorea]
MSIINTNMSSLNAQRNMAKSSNDLQTSMTRLSSGLRVNSAKDDAAGLSIATKMDSQIRGMTQASRNANDGISMIQTADGAMSNISDALQRMRELAVQAANGTNGADETGNIGTEMSALNDEIARIADTTSFNGKSLMKSGAPLTVDIQVGANKDESIKVAIADSDGYAKFTAATDLKVDTPANAGATIAKIDGALKALNTERASLGTAQNRMGYAISNLSSSIENQSAAKSRIMDTDYASETSKLSRAQILQQAGTAMLAQANSAPNNVMSLLRG